MTVKSRKGRLRWKRTRANHGRKPTRSLPKAKFRKSNK